MYKVILHGNILFLPFLHNFHKENLGKSQFSTSYTHYGYEVEYMRLSIIQNNELPYH